jgi:LPXTG-site transpeptidase (sortase) family protein
MTDRTSTGQASRWQRVSIAVLGVGLASLLGAAVLLVISLAGDPEKGNSQALTNVSFNESVAAALTPLATPTLVHPTPDPSAIAAFVIPKFGVDAPIQIKGIDANNQMESPDGPANVAWYDFSAAPGNIGNGVYSGHVDYINYGPAVFWHIRELSMGDEIQVRLISGTVYKYRVIGSEDISANPTQEQLASVLGQTENEIITMITCTGAFNYATHEYDQRHIVRAERVLEPLSAQAP